MILTTLLKDLLSYRVLLPIMDIIADPDFINHIMIILLEGKVTYYPDVSQRPKVILLKHMCAQIPITKPVIQVRLKEIVHNQDLLFIFMNFMKSEGVLNLIQFYMSLEDFMKLILNPDLKVQQIDILYRQCQQIYQNFFDASSPDKIDFDETTINQMKEITEDKPENVLKLRNTSPLYTAREHVVSLLDNIFIPLFCQSGSFMNWILGEKGFAADKLNQKLGKKSTEVMVAVSKLGNRIKGVFKPSPQIDNTDSTEFIHGRYSFKPEIKQFTKTNDRIPDFSNEDEISSISSGDLFNELTPKDNISSFYHSFSTPTIHQEDQLDDDGQALKLILSRAVVENERDISKLHVTLSKIESRIDFNGRQNFYFLISVRRKENGISLADQSTLTNELNINQSTSISEVPPPPTSSVMFDMEDDDGISMKSESSTYSNRQRYNLLAATGSPSPREWVVERRYMEFYLLESKLTEFHGVFEDIQLPAKRVFNAKDWAFVNSKRSSFETYLRKLCTKSELKTSELLYTFLTSSEDFYEFCAGISASGGGGPGNFLLPDIGIGKMLKAPLRLLPEKGQHLEPFLQSFIASTGVYDDNNSIKRSRQQPIPPVEINKSDTPPYDYNNNKDTTPSISSSSANVKNGRTIEQFHPYNSWIDNSLFRRDFSHFNSINTTTDPNNNNEMPLTAPTGISEPKNKFHMDKSKKKRKQYAITGLYDYLIYFCFNIYRVPEWMIKLLLAFRLGLKPIFELYVARIISRKTRLLTHPIFINDTLKLINKSIFPGEVKSAAAQSPESIEICKKERADKARQLAKDNSSALLKWILPQKNIEEGTDLIFQCFQHPILNKHLAYMLLDSLISAMFPELAKPTISLSSK